MSFRAFKLSGLCLLAVLGRPVAAQVHWQPLAPGSANGIAAVYDSGRDRIVSLNTLGETWEFDGTGWSRVATGGPFLAVAGMAYDAGRVRTVLTSGGVVGKTWEWDGSTWMLVSSSGPVPHHSRVVYHEGRGTIVLFGGRNLISLSPRTYRPSNDLYEWDGASWQAIPAVNPPPTRIGSEYAYYDFYVYDAARQKLVVFGVNKQDPLRNQWTRAAMTWEWDSFNGWQQVQAGGVCLSQ